MLIAYFSMEVAVDAQIPTYSGGLGILAGDTLRSAADLEVPMVGITLLAREGYFHQQLDENGVQRESVVEWSIPDKLVEHGHRVTVSIEGRSVHLRAWEYQVRGQTGHVIPVYLLDTDLPENADDDRRLTDRLYGGDDRYRLSQEIVLGIGGVRMLQALGHQIDKYHLNEGHSALLTLELLREQDCHKAPEADVFNLKSLSVDRIESVRKQCVFTTHTPVPAGHDRFSIDLVDAVLGHRRVCDIARQVCLEGQLNMTYLALSLCGYVNGVAKRHGEISQQMFAEYNIDAITNGVHAATWVCESFAKLFDQYVAGWRNDNFSLRYASLIPDEEIWQAHQRAKQRLIQHINSAVEINFDPEILTLGFARRSTAYKRGELLVSDIDRLRNVSRHQGPLQIVFAGKAHPKDEEGKQIIKRIFQKARSLQDDIKIVYLPNYDMSLAKILIPGVDVWVNTPEPPLEASGTSGMKAAMNGVPSLSVLDGWWIEGCLPGITGWAIGSRNHEVHDANAESLYSQLENEVLPCYYQQHENFVEIMKHAISLNGSFFNTHRMVHEYINKAYRA